MLKQLIGAPSFAEDGMGCDRSLATAANRSTIKAHAMMDARMIKNDGVAEIC